jgi:hypothetical protein
MHSRIGRVIDSERGTCVAVCWWESVAGRLPSAARTESTCKFSSMDLISDPPEPADTGT